MRQKNCNHPSKQIFLIKSARDAFADRYQIRRFLGAKEAILGNFLFLLGTGRAKKTTDARIRNEILEYNDIIIADFEDTYENLPTKTKAILKFAAVYCSNSMNNYYIIDSDQSSKKTIVFHSYILENSGNFLNFTKNLILLVNFYVLNFNY